MKKIVFLLMISISVKAQQYVAEAPLPSIDKEGFYEIPLPPRITTWVEDDYRGLRIIDDNGTEVGYIKNIDRMQYSTYAQKEFRIERTITKGCCTTITLFNDEKSTIDNFVLEVKNASVSKTAVLRGSDDGKTWFALKENINLNFGNESGKFVTEVFDFPLSDYPYYQLTIADSASSPINIIKAWQVEPGIIRGRYVEIPSVKFQASDTLKNNTTYVNIRFDTPQHVHKIELDVEGPRFYKRVGTLWRGEIPQSKEKHYYEVTDFEIVSGQTPLITLSEKNDDFLMMIHNQDDPPLTIKNVRAFQLKQSIIAWLEPGKNYRIVFGKDLQAPAYDLEFFKDSIPSNPSTLEIGELKENVKPATDTTTPTYFTNRNLIWIAIIFVIAILGFMSYRMLNEKKGSH